MPVNSRSMSCNKNPNPRSLSGLTCIKTFIESGFEVVCYEKSPHFGGLWHYNTTSDVDGDNFHPSIMRTTILNTSKELSSFSDFPPPPKLPNFMNHSLYMDYIKSYVKHFNISPHLRLRHEVLRCKQDCEPESGQIFWELEVRNLETGELSKKRFDKLVVASGHHNSPFMPTLSGQDKFKGLIIHSMYVKDILTDERFKGKNVLVIGIGNSACDAANDLALVANRCYLSCHRGTWFLSRLTNEGLYDFRLNNRWAQWMSRHIPTSMSDRRVIKWAERNMSHKLLGLRPKHKPTELVPTVNDIFPYRVFTGGVVLKTSVSRFTENGVKFEGDEEEECPVDVVVFATGYKAQTPFLRDLESGIRSSQNSDEYDLFLNIFAPRLSSTEQKANGRDLSSPVESLAFIGYLQVSWIAMKCRLRLKSRSLTHTHVCLIPADRFYSGHCGASGSTCCARILGRDQIAQH